MKIKKLKYMPYAQAHVKIMSNGNIYLWSYWTLVAGIENNMAFCNGLYSQTTRRHISAFAKEYGRGYMTYDTFKMMFEDNMMLDLTTGEVVERQ